jgi:hypothetical protein
MSPLMKLTRHLLVAGAVPVLLLGLAATTGTVTLSPAIAAEKGKSATTGAAGVARQEQQQAQQKLVASGRTPIIEQGAAVPDYDAIVAAMSRAVGQLSGDIAAAIAAKPPAAAPKRTRSAGSGA